MGGQVDQGRVQFPVGPLLEFTKGRFFAKIIFRE